ncbi:hypothetical protein ESB00_05445 [Oleiharenicola lentus]|uniref:Uncharacterized protein n=1 Tax=Oleiharenicola lentus TaxID=2508720 RepID=A0A4Q1C8Q8_9BACT|nr:hypothetical protein [Oleiharenicola lentus]RXK55343.1 hypothetical protein ESB00_05445 [Oleiharenicola lentus]
MLILLLLPASLSAEKLVIARSSVFGDYLEKRRVDGKLQPQSYVFMPGRFLSGNTRDRSLERFSFRALAGRLAQDLRRQDFHPAASLAQADLLLVVHWGATAGRNRDLVALSDGFDTLANLGTQAEVFRGELDQAIEAGDFLQADALRGNLDQLANSARQEQQSLLNEERNVGGADTATLLGFTAEMSRDDGTLAEQERRKTLFDLTREECYFVVVMAYDARTLVGTKKLKRVWTLRVSINTAGVNFPEALDRISQVSGQHFGRPQEGLTFAYPPKRLHEGSVRLDDIVVLGTVVP